MGAAPRVALWLARLGPHLVPDRAWGENEAPTLPIP